MHVFSPKSQRFMGLEDDWADPRRSGFVVLPVPFECTSSYGQGSSHGPAAILAASSQVELFDMSLGFEPFRQASGIVTLSALEFEPDDAQSLDERLCATVNDWLTQGKRVVTLGGEHTSIVGAVRAYSQFYDDLTVVQFDAHADLRDQYENNRWNHACAAARILDFHTRLVQVGVRSQAAEEHAKTARSNIPVFAGEDAPVESSPRFEPWLDEIIAATSKRIYITFDCDVLDPAIMPATGTPEPGGLGWHQIDGILAALAARREIVGFDVCELAPVAGLNHPQFTIAKLIYRLIGHICGRQ